MLGERRGPIVAVIEVGFTSGSWRHRGLVSVLVYGPGSGRGRLLQLLVECIIDDPPPIHQFWLRRTASTAVHPIHPLHEPRATQSGNPLMEIQGNCASGWPRRPLATDTASGGSTNETTASRWRDSSSRQDRITRVRAGWERDAASSLLCLLPIIPWKFFLSIVYFHFSLVRDDYEIAPKLFTEL